MTWVQYVRACAYRAARGLFTIVLAFLLSASLLRFSPGWNVVEQELDARYSASTLKKMREERTAARSLLRFYLDFPVRIFKGDFGTSEVYRRPVADLLRERAATTVKTVLAGLLAGWAAALIFAAAAIHDRTGVVATGSVSLSGALLSFPSALLAIACLALNLAPAAAIACVVFSRVFSQTFQQFREQSTAAYTVMARARGTRPLRLLRWYILTGALPVLWPLAGASVPLAFGGAIPVESLADSAGLGQLAWNAALGRDLPLLVVLTLLLTSISVAAGLLTDARARNVQEMGD